MQLPAIVQQHLQARHNKHEDEHTPLAVHVRGCCCILLHTLRTLGPGMGEAWHAAAVVLPDSNLTPREMLENQILEGHQTLTMTSLRILPYVFSMYAAFTSATVLSAAVCNTACRPSRMNSCMMFLQACWSLAQGGREGARQRQ